MKNYVNDVKKQFLTFKSFTASDKHKVMKNKNAILSILQNSSFAGLFDDAKVFFDMLIDYFSGRYNNVPYGAIAAIIGTLLYILNPVDIIPDCIFPVGYTDDAFLLKICLNFIRHDLEQYKNFKNRCFIKKVFKLPKLF